MTGHRTKLPPLNTLKAFHAVMTQDSLRAAAAALSVTPQAVSQQIKLLEIHVQVKLFTRHGRTTQPTKDAVILARYVERGFDEFVEGMRQIGKHRSPDRINLNVTPYFATRYLIPRLDSFRRLQPNCDLRLSTKIETPDFVRDEIDAAIQWGYDDGWPDQHSSLLARDHKIICCAPGLIKEGRPLSSPADLIHHTLLNVSVPNSLWGDILAHLEVDVPDPGSILFDDASSMRRATLAGMGVGLISGPDADDDIKSGELTAPFGRNLLAELPEHKVPGFYLVYPKMREQVDIVAAFCAWIEDEEWTGNGLADFAGITNRAIP